MRESNDLVNVMNDLIQINRDRIQGYKTAKEDIKDIDADLHTLFGQKISQSEDFLRDLEPIVTKHGGEPETGVNTSGKLFRSWMDFKASLTGQDRQAVLNSCEFGEKAALDEYEDALETSADIPADVRQMIMDQKDKIQSSLNSIQNYSDVDEKLR